jgi:hypothetical protein
MGPVTVLAADRCLNLGYIPKPDDPAANQRESRELGSAMGAGVEFWRGFVHFHDIFYGVDDLHVPS